jgi:hypothetical protein
MIRNGFFVSPPNPADTATAIIRARGTADDPSNCLLKILDRHPFENLALHRLIVHVTNQSRSAAPPSPSRSENVQLRGSRVPAAGIPEKLFRFLIRFRI